MKKPKIVVVDSGVGGLHVLRACIKCGVVGDFVYYADNQNAPFGTKSAKQLKKIAFELVQDVCARFKPDVVVFACNTLTVNAIKYVRKKFPNQIFVGAEPELKKALIYGGNTIFLATPSTQKHFNAFKRKLQKSLQKQHKKMELSFDKTAKILPITFANLATEIDKNPFDVTKCVEPLFKLLQSEQFANFQNLILGCTHYIALRPFLSKNLPQLQIFDGSCGVARRVKSLQKSLNNIKNASSKVKFVTTKKDKNFENKLKNYFNLLKNN